MMGEGSKKDAAQSEEKASGNTLGKTFHSTKEELSSRSISVLDA